MEYLPMVNLLLEALAYLGRRAAGNTAQRLLDKLQGNGVTDLSQFRRQLDPLEALARRLDRCIVLDEDLLHSLFDNLPGFPYNTIGSYSPGFLLLCGQVSRFDGDLDHTLDRLRNLPPEELAGLLALGLDMSDGAGEPEPLSGSEFSARVLGLSIPAESKVAILDLYHRRLALLDQLEPVLRRTLACLAGEREALEAICLPFTGELHRMGPAHFIAQTSGLRSQTDQGYSLRPFVFGLDTNLAVPAPAGPAQVYCGILRGPIQAMLSNSRGPEYQVYNAIKLLGDRTRFDILCYLRGRKAYGQELAVKFGLSRNTIHHHMSKLLAARLVTCTVDGNRVYYTVDRETVEALLEGQRRLLLE